MDEATLTIRFKDESSPGPAGVATTSPQYSGSDPGSVKVADVQNAITQAGGVGAWGAKNNQASSGGGGQPVAAPVPPAGSLPVPPIPAVGGGDPLLKTVQNIVQADANVTADEIAKALGINQKQAQTLLNAATVQPGGQQSSAPTAPLPVPPASQQPVPPVAVQPPVPVPPVAPPPVAGTAQPQTAGTPQAPPVQNQPMQPPGQPPQGANAEHGVQQAVNAIAGLAAQAGPLGAAAGRAASATAAIPGVGLSLAEAAPGLAAAAPIIGAAAAALAIPAAGALALSSIANTARGQAAGFSPELAQAEAEAMIRQIRANQATAGRLGDETADFVRQRSRISSAAQGARDTLAEPLLQDFNNALRTLATIGESLSGFLAENPDIAKTIAEGVKVLSPLYAVLSAIGKRLEKQERDKTKFDAGSFFNVVPQIPTVDWDDFIPRAHERKIGGDNLPGGLHVPGLGFEGARM